MSAEGFAVIPNWLVRDPSIPGRTKLVYMVLSSHTGKTGTWWISHADIASEASLSVSSVQRSLRELRDMGLVTWEQRTVDGGTAENAYRLVITTPGVTPDRPPRSPVPTPSVTVTEEEEEPQEEPKEQTPSPKPGLGMWFEEFWEVYPRRIAKADAQRRYGHWSRRVDPRRINDAAIRYGEQVRAEGRVAKHIKYPASWLNTEPWEDGDEQVTAEVTPGVSGLTAALTDHDLVERWGPLVVDYGVALARAQQYMATTTSPTHDGFAAWRILHERDG